MDEKKTLVKKILILITAFLLLGNHKVFAQTEKIQSFNESVVINEDATINIVEKIVYDFGDQVKHGIYRNIPTIKTNKQGKKFRLDINVSSVKDEIGTAYQYSVTNSGDILSLKIGDPNQTLTGIHTYVISYVVAGEITYFSDHDELYWNVTGNDWTVPILSATSEIDLPANISQSELNLKCFTGASGSTDSFCEVKNAGNKATFTTTNNLNANEGLTIVAGFPINLVAHLEPKEVINFSDTWYGKIIIKLAIAVLILISIFWYTIYPIWIPIKWYLFGRDPSTPQSGEVRAWFDAPKGKDGKPLTPEETGALINEKVDMRDITSMIVSLAQRGYIKIEEKKKNDFYFTKTRDFTGADLQAFEQKFLDAIFDGDNSIRLKDEKLYDDVKDATDGIYAKLVEDKFFLKNPNSVRTYYKVIAGLAVATFNLPLIFSALIFGLNIPKKTPDGVAAANVAKSMRNFLSSQERELNFQGSKQLMFEKLLPYAVAFGVEKNWAERFKDINLKQPDWYSSYNGGSFNSILFISSMNSSFDSFRSSATPVTSSSGFSSGFSGGSSGGGGGGGGGGSW